MQAADKGGQCPTERGSELGTVLYRQGGFSDYNPPEMRQQQPWAALRSNGMTLCGRVRQLRQSESVRLARSGSHVRFYRDQNSSHRGGRQAASFDTTHRGGQAWRV